MKEMTNFVRYWHSSEAWAEAECGVVYLC